MGKPEAKVENHLREGAIARQGMCTKLIDVGRRGHPDRTLRFQGPKTIYVETKAKDGRLEPWQDEYHKDLRSLGYVVLVLWTVAQVDKFYADFDQGVYG
jgi:hypothetical protein